MTQLSPSQARVIDPILSTVAQGYKNAELIGSALFPYVPVGQRGGKIITFGKEDFMLYATGRSPGAATKRVQFGYSGSSYALESHSLEGLVPQELMQEAEAVPGINLATNAIAKVQAIIDTLLPVASMDEVFICGPEAMIEATERALLAAGVPENRVHTERFTSGPAQAAKIQADTDAAPHKQSAAKDIALTIVLDGKEHELHIGADEHVLDAALDAGLDLPFSCKAGVCCTCRAKVLCGEVVMDKNFTLEADEVKQGFVLSCQARATTKSLTVSFDDR